MRLEVDLVFWASTRPGWQQDVLVRLSRQEVFDARTIAEIADGLLAGQGAPTLSLTTINYPDDVGVAAGVQLCAIRDVMGVNALAPDQRLTFGEQGITIIYGDNGSGKSGYARILKAAAGARRGGEILGDVFAKGPPGPQSAMVDFRVSGSDSVQQWKWPGEASQPLQQVHFFDKAESDAYLVAESEITYRPSALVLLDQLVTVCDKVRAVLDERLRAIDSVRPALPVVPRDTHADRFITGLTAATTDKEITTACIEPADTKEQLSQVLAEEARLKASDPTRERGHLNGLATKLGTIVNYCEQLGPAASADGIEKIGALRTTATQLRAAATIASSESFEAEPVGGVGSTTWRALWESARAFSETEAYHDHDFPVTVDGARCVLCHQELSEAANERLRRFQAFVTDRTERDAVRAEEALAKEEQVVRDLTHVPSAVTEAVAGLQASDPGFADAVDAWITTATATVTAILRWLDGATDDRPPPASSSPVAELKERRRTLQEQAASIDATTFAQQISTATRRAAELQGQIALAASTDAVRDEVQRLRERAKIEKVKKATDTGPITRKASELTRDHVTREVIDEFTRQSDRLRLRRITLDHTSGVKGRLLHRPALLGAARREALSEVLSEGEQTALGLSGFLTEVVFDTSRSGVVLDDPVTSLDHVRRSLVAEQLVTLARDRQVLVFTHEVSFVGDLLRHAREAGVPVTERWVQHNGDAVGVCADKHPWKAKDIGARISVLETELAEIKREKNDWDQDTYEERCASWAGKLSEAWERAVNLEIVNPVVDRGTSQVQPKMFRLFAAITERDNAEFQAGYGRCSEWARRHDKDPVVNFVAPDPADLESELQRFRDWSNRIKGYKTK